MSPTNHRSLLHRKYLGNIMREKNTITFPFYEPAKTRRTRLIFVTSQERLSQQKQAMPYTHCTYLKRYLFSEHFGQSRQHSRGLSTVWITYIHQPLALGCLLFIYIHYIIGGLFKCEDTVLPSKKSNKPFKWSILNWALV